MENVELGSILFGQRDALMNALSQCLVDLHTAKTRFMSFTVCSSFLNLGRD